MCFKQCNVVFEWPLPLSYHTTPALTIDISHLTSQATINEWNAKLLPDVVKIPQTTDKQDSFFGPWNGLKPQIMRALEKKKFLTTPDDPETYSNYLTMNKPFYNIKLLLAPRAWLPLLTQPHALSPHKLTICWPIQMLVVTQLMWVLSQHNVLLISILISISTASTIVLI